MTCRTKGSSLLRLCTKLTACRISLHQIQHNLVTRTFVSSSSPSKSGNYVSSEEMGPVTVIGINRPDKRNCINIETGLKLEEAFSSFERDDSAMVAVLYGYGGNFCAGFDLGELSTLDDAEDKDFKEPAPGLGFMGPTRRFFSKPVIAAISGYAVAGGMEMALMCDLRVVEDTAVMGVFCRRFGVPLLDGGTVRLPQLIGLSRALDLIMTGRPVTSKEALDIGLANRVVATGTALGQSIQLAKSLTKFPQECLLADRRSAIHSVYSATSLQDAFRYEWENGTPILQKESVKGAKGFVQGVGKSGSFNISSPKDKH